MKRNAEEYKIILASSSKLEFDSAKEMLKIFPYPNGYEHLPLFGYTAEQDSERFPRPIVELVGLYKIVAVFDVRDGRKFPVVGIKDEQGELYYLTDDSVKKIYDGYYLDEMEET